MQKDENGGECRIIVKLVLAGCGGLEWNGSQTTFDSYFQRLLIFPQDKSWIIF